jgi:hypothetical protein
MNRDEAKTILLLYRPGTTDVDDPEIAEALALAESDPELTRWLDAHCARHEALRSGFRKITAPAGLKEQIIAEQAAKERPGLRRRRLVLAAAVVVAALVILTPLWLSHRSKGEADHYANWRDSMASIALRDYRMDLVTNNPAAIRAFLAQKEAPADYVLPAPLEQTAVTGCAIEYWRGLKVSMICFRTGKPLAHGKQSDLWLFVVDRAAVRNAPPADEHRFDQVSRLGMITWTAGDKLYLLGTAGNEQAVRQYL